MPDTGTAANGSASFRFLRLSDSQSDELRKAFPQAKFGRHYKTGGNVGVVPLNSSELVIKLDEFRRSQRIKVMDCDLIISIYSTRGDEMWRAPRAVNYLVNIVNCPIVFSFSSSCDWGESNGANTNRDGGSEDDEEKKASD
jgi:hypothetical protein